MSAATSIPSAGRRWLIMIAVMAATLMQVLDTTIANVAMPQMQAALGATPESVAWVLTSYMIMAAIATPITGWLEIRFGRRNLFAISIAGFTIASALCGMAISLQMMVAARALQGIFGAFIGPLGQATLLDSSPREKHPQTMMIWGMGVMIGPILGPVLGGWLTDNYGWRWVFYINVPIGLAATVAIWGLIGKIQLPRRSFDLIGFAFLALALASFQLMLDRGSQQDWFNSTEIIIDAAIALGAVWMFVVHSISAKEPLVSLELFSDRNFMISVVFTMLITGVSMAGSALVAPMLQTLMGYDAMGTGMLMMPRGLGVVVAFPVATYLSRKVDNRLLIASGLALTALSLRMMSHFDPLMGKEPFIYSGVVQGLGLGFAFLPLNILAFSTLASHLRTEAAALYSLTRSLGGSATISIMSAILSRNVQVNHAELGEHLSFGGLHLMGKDILGHLGEPGGMVMRMLDLEINRQALFIAYMDDFWLMMWVAIFSLPLVFFLGKPRAGAESPPVHLE